jgi:hypothetical protein
LDFVVGQGLVAGGQHLDDRFDVSVEVVGTKVDLFFQK